MNHATKPHTPIAALFEQWWDLYLEIDAMAQITDDDLNAETDRLNALEVAALDLTPTSVLDLYRQLAMSIAGSIDPDPDATDYVIAHRLLAKTRAALGVLDAT
jgi:hypothetical protein